jgi:quercetin dioxygenase-like cupin family protein
MKSLSAFFHTTTQVLCSALAVSKVTLELSRLTLSGASELMRSGALGLTLVRSFTCPRASEQIGQSKRQRIEMMNSPLTIVVVGLVCVTSTASAQTSRDAVAVDPTHHHVIMENDHVRVFEVLAAPGASSPMHTHPPLVAISLENARLRVTAPDGTKSVLDLAPSQVIWMEDVEHSWELLSGQVRLVAVEVKPATNEAPAARKFRPGPRDAVAVDPTHHHVVMENDHVRVFEVLSAPGSKSPMHTHTPMLAVSLNRARLSMAVPEGTKSIFDFHPAQVLWLEGAEHSWELLAGDLHVIAVEVKAAQAAADTGQTAR